MQTLIDEADHLLDEYQVSKGLPNISPSTEVERFLKLSLNDLKNMTSEECGEAAYLVESFALYIQKEINIEEARIKWANNYLPLVIADEARQQKGYSYEERKYLAIKHNNAAKKIYTIKTKSEQRKDRFNYLATRLSKLSDTFKDLSYTKRGKNE